MTIYTLFNDEELVVREATEEDGEGVIDLLNQIGGESQHLTFGRNELGITLEQEQNFIAKHRSTPNMLFILGEYKGKMVGMLNFSGGSRERIAHCGMFGMAVLKACWGMGVGTALVDYMLEWAEEGKIIRKIELQVKADNERAIRLYKRMGFEVEGRSRRSIQIHGQFYDTLYMGKLID